MNTEMKKTVVYSTGDKILNIMKEQDMDCLLYTSEVEEEYTVTILEVTLTAKDLNVVVAGRMNEEQREIYAF